jgi:hypothetical protein
LVPVHPPIAYTAEPVAAAAKLNRAVGRSGPLVHVSVAGSYTSTFAVIDPASAPPTTYNSSFCAIVTAPGVPSSGSGAASV